MCRSNFGGVGAAWLVSVRVSECVGCVGQTLAEWAQHGWCRSECRSVWDVSVKLWRSGCSMVGVGQSVGVCGMCRSNFGGVGAAWLVSVRVSECVGCVGQTLAEWAQHGWCRSECRSVWDVSVKLWRSGRSMVSVGQSVGVCRMCRSNFGGVGAAGLVSVRVSECVGCVGQTLAEWAQHGWCRSECRSVWDVSVKLWRSGWTGGAAYRCAVQWRPEAASGGSGISCARFVTSPSGAAHALPALAARF